MEYYRIGIDEAGRGSLMGRVYAGAVCFPENGWMEDAVVQKIVIRDSKKMTAKARQKSREYIEKTTMWGIGYTSEEEVDRLGIVPANILAMHRAIDCLLEKHPELLVVKKKELKVDGTCFRDYPDIPHELVVRGESVHPEIASASILAKTHRDEHVLELCNADVDLLRYHLDTNKGYGTAAHLKALKEHGASRFHRRTFIHAYCPPISYLSS
jgi:ribonuclease HII